MSRLLATRRLFHLGIAVAFAAFIALTSQTWLPAAALIPIMGAILFAFLEVLLPLPITMRRTVELGDQLLMSDEAKIEIVAKPAPIPQNLQLEDGIPEGLRVLEDSYRPFESASDGQALSRYTLKPRRRGEYAFPQATFRRTSILGLFERVVEVPTDTKITVLPTSVKQLGVKVRPRPPTRTSEMSRSLRRGPGDEFFALRQYLPGDNIHDINWKASARTQRIITNEYLPQEPPRYLVYVDTRGATAEVGEADAFERTLELTAILVEALLESHAHVGLVLLSLHSVFLVPSAGANQLRRLRQMIIDCQPGQEAPLADLVTAGMPHLPARADAVLITANVYDPTLASAVAFLRNRHGKMQVLFPGFPEPDGTTLDAAAQRAAGVLLNTEQAAALEGLKPYADQVLQWPPTEPIAVTLSRLGMAGRSR